MGLFGKKEDPEDLMYQAMTFLEKNQPKAAVSLFKKVTKIIQRMLTHGIIRVWH